MYLCIPSSDLAAQTNRAELRHADLIGRLGGDELVVLLGGTRGPRAAASARTVGERLRRGIAGLRVGAPDGSQSRLTVSIGAAVVPDAADLDELIAVADQAMYRVKKAGGDGVAVVQTSLEDRAGGGVGGDRG